MRKYFQQQLEFGLLDEETIYEIVELIAKGGHELIKKKRERTA